MSQPRYSLRSQRDEWYSASRIIFVTWQIECAVVSWCSWLNRRVSPSTLPRNWILWASWTRLGSMRACQRQSGMESTRFQYLYNVAPSRRLSTQKADTTEATNGLGEIVFVEPNEQQAFLELCHGEKRRQKSNVFVNPNEHRLAFLELCHSEKAKSTRRMKSMIQMRLCC